MSALDDLIAAVEAGGNGPDTLYRAIPMHAEIPTRHLVARIMNNGMDMTAAIGLHEALLPGTSQYSIVTDPTCLCVKVAWWPKGLCGGVEIQGEGWDEGNPARAWLLAILRALKSQEGRE